MTQHLVLDQIIDAADARVVVQRAADGGLLDAHFDMTGLPRVDAMMVGRPVADVPALAERLCGICPVAHHLAGVQALEALWGPVELTPTAQAVRRLLNFGSVIDGHVLGFVSQDLPAVMALRRLAKAAMAAAASPKHFPTTAVPGGVRQAVQPGDVDSVLLQVPPAFEAAQRLVAASSHASLVEADGSQMSQTGLAQFTGADVALVDASGMVDLLGARLWAVASDGTVIVDGATPGQWDATVQEARPGESAPQPYLTVLGPQFGLYRTGPVAQLRVGRLATPLAEAARQRWLADGGGAAAARAIVVLHCVEAIGELCQATELTGDDIGLPLAPKNVDGVGIGWAETGRGLLVHRYAGSADGLVTKATILTPTAQNEPWLAALLARASASPDAGMAMEDAIREADPCLPCSTAAPGQMGLVVETVYESSANPQPQGD